MRDPIAERLAEDPVFRLQVAPSTFVYDCYANPIAGVECTFWYAGASTVEFPVEARA